jgi:hypothetical protein
MLIFFFEFIFLYFFFAISTVGYGKLLLKILNVKKYYAGLSGIIGLFFYAFLATFLHFFFSISEKNNLTILLLGLLIFIYTNKNKLFEYFQFNLKKIIIIFFILTTFLMFYSYKPHEDFGFYHLPYIKSFLSEKIIFGFVNINDAYLWNSMLFNLSALFTLPHFGIKGIFIVPLIFYSFFILILINEIFVNLNKNYFYPSNIFSLLVLFYFIIKFSRIAEFGVDVPSHILGLLVILYFIKFHEFNNISSDERYYFIVLILLLSIFSLTVKISNISILIFPFFILILNLKFLNFKKVLFPFLFLLIFSFLWIIQQFIYSGCFFFPLNFTCFDTIWSSKKNIQEIVSLLEVTNKSFGVYKGELMANEYVQNFNWISNWFSRNKIEFVEHVLAIFIAPFLLLLTNANLRNKNKKTFFIINSRYFYLCIIFYIFLSFFIWFSKSPVARFATIFFIVSFFFIIYLISIKKKYFNFNNKSIVVIILICLIFNLNKNFLRLLKNKDIESFWPKIIDNKFITIQKINENIYQNKPNNELNTGIQGALCWNIDFICSYTNKKLTYKFYKSYLIIEN